MHSPLLKITFKNRRNVKKDLYSSSMHRVIKKITNVERSCKAVEKSLSDLLLFDSCPKINTIFIFLNGWFRDKVT